MSPRRTPPSVNRAEVRLGAFRRNLALIRSRLSPGARILLVVKSDAYGHGMIPIAQAAARDASVVYFGVAAPEEAKSNARTAQLQNELWAAIGPAATAHPTPVMALVLNGMNDVLNSQGYAQAAWWNRIPPAAWLLMLVIAMGCCVSVGYGARNFRRERWLLLSVPFIVATSFFSIADIDSPRNGVIRVVPLNLHSLVDSLAPKN